MAVRSLIDKIRRQQRMNARLLLRHVLLRRSPEGRRILERARRLVNDVPFDDALPPVPTELSIDPAAILMPDTLPEALQDTFDPAIFPGELLATIEPPDDAPFNPFDAFAAELQEGSLPSVSPIRADTEANRATEAVAREFPSPNPRPQHVSPQPAAEAHAAEPGLQQPSDASMPPPAPESDLPRATMGSAAMERPAASGSQVPPDSIAAQPPPVPSASSAPEPALPASVLEQSLPLAVEVASPAGIDAPAEPAHPPIIPEPLDVERAEVAAPELQPLSPVPHAPPEIQGDAAAASPAVVEPVAAPPESKSPPPAAQPLIGRRVAYVSTTALTNADQPAPTPPTTAEPAARPVSPASPRPAAPGPSAPPIDAGALFEPVAEPVTPQEWARRLMAAQRPAEPPVPAAPVRPLDVAIPPAAPEEIFQPRETPITPQEWAGRLFRPAHPAAQPLPAAQRPAEPVAPPAPVTPPRSPGAAIPPTAPEEVFQPHEAPITPQEWARRLFRPPSPAGQPPANPATPAARVPAETLPPTSSRAPVTPAPPIQSAVRRAADVVRRPPNLAPARSIADPGNPPRRTVRAVPAQNVDSALPASAAPTPLPEATRRFLRPLVGIDPATVQVYRGPAAQELTDALEADALTAGSDIVLGSDQPEGSAEDLGLLAHELTHIARERDPQFVPPVLSGERPPEQEEQIAVRVEGRVRRVARAISPRMVQPADSGLPPSVALRTFEQPPDAAAPKIPPPERAQTAEEAAPPDRWGGLPAPWEPLPAWVSAPPPSATAPMPPMPAHRSVAAVPSAAQRPAVAPVQRAETGRAVDEGPPLPNLAPPTVVSEPEAAPEPDLDSLARQVYDRLKYRLAAERRRAGS